jgi:ABC-2 type transport system ATP-binding protein
MWGVNDLVVTYGTRRAVSGVTLSVVPGRITALVGGDGAGKSSVLRAMVGVVFPTAGQVTTAPAEEIGYVSAGPGLYRDLTVEENLTFCGRAYGMEPDEMDAGIDELLDRTDLQAARHRPAGKLSGGMRQKLALAMAMLPRPNLLVLDEPTTGVDPVSRAELWRLIAAEAADGAAVLIATSYLDEAERAEEVVVLVDGTVLVAGSPEEILEAAQGSLHRFPGRPEAWRRGDSWVVWSPEPVDLSRPEPVADLEDVVVIGELLRQRSLERPERAVPA